MREAPALAAVLGGGHALPFLLVAIAAAPAAGPELLALAAVLVVSDRHAACGASTPEYRSSCEYGRLVPSAPIASGETGNETPAGAFRITAAHRRHQSSLYTIEDTDTPYPTH